MKDLQIGYEKGSLPHIKANHVDGPMLSLRDGRVYWLNWRERIALFFGRTNAFKLERKHWKTAP